MNRKRLQFLSLIVVLAIIFIALFSYNKSLVSVKAEEGSNIPDFTEITEGDGYTYDSESFILYLRGINWTGDITLPINTEESVFSIVVESGKNYISGSIIANQNLSISGDGSLEITSSNTTTIQANGEVEFSNDYLKIVNTSTDNDANAITLTGNESSLKFSFGHVIISSTNGNGVYTTNSVTGNISFNGGFVEITAASYAIRNTNSLSSIILSESVVILKSNITIYNPTMEIQSGVIEMNGTSKFAVNGASSNGGDGAGVVADDSPTISMEVGFGFYIVSGETITEMEDVIDQTIYFSDIENDNIKHAIIAKGVYKNYTSSDREISSIYVFGSLTTSEELEAAPLIMYSYIETSVLGKGFTPSDGTVINNKLFFSNTLFIDPPTNLTTEFNYDGEAKSIEFPEDGEYYVVNPEANTLTNPGESAVIIALDNFSNDFRPVWSDTYSSENREYILKISKVTVLPPAAPSVDTFTYDGEIHSLDILSSEYYTISNNELINASTVDVIVSLSDSNFYMWSDTLDSDDKSFTLTVNPLTVTRPTVVTDPFTYDSQEHSLDIPESEYYYVGAFNTRFMVGTTDVSVILYDTENYVWDDGTTDDLSFPLTINPFVVAKPNVDSESFPYDGLEHSLDIPESDYYQAYDNVLIYVGSVNVTIALNDRDNYIWDDETNDDIILTLTVYDETHPSYDGYISYIIDSHFDIDNPNPETYSASQTYTFLPLSHPGINFIGWYEDDTYTKEVVDTSLFSDYVVLYAKFEYVSYEIVLDYNGITYKQKESVSLGTFRSDEEVSLSLSDYVPSSIDFVFNGFRVGDKTYSFNLTTDINLINNIVQGVVTLKASYSIDYKKDDSELSSRLEFLSTNLTPLPYGAFSGMSFTITSMSPISDNEVLSIKDSIISSCLSTDKYYIDDDEIFLKPTSSYTLSLISGDTSVQSLDSNTLLKVIIPINGFEEYFTKYAVVSNNELIAVAKRCDKFGNENINGKYLSFATNSLSSFNIVGVKALIYRPRTEEMMVFEYENGHMPESLNWFFKEYNNDFYQAKSDYDYSVGNHYLIVTPKAGYYLRGDYNNQETLDYTSGSNESIKVSYSIKKEYTDEEMAALPRLTLSDFNVRFSSISLKTKYLDKIMLLSYEDEEGRTTYIYDNGIRYLSEGTAYTYTICYYYVENDTYMSSDYFYVDVSFVTMTLESYITELNSETDKYPQEFIDFINNLPESFPKDALDDIILAFEKLDSLKDATDTESKYYERKNAYIEGKKVEILNNVKDLTSYDEVRYYLSEVSYDLGDILSNINESLNELDTNIINNEDISKDLENKYSEYVDSLVDHLFESLDSGELTNEELKSKTEFITNTSKTLSDLNTLYSNEVESNDSLLTNLYDNKVKELMSEEYRFNMDVNQFSKFYEYVDSSVKGVKTLMNAIRNCDGENSRFALSIKTSIKVIEVTTFRDYNKDEMDELFYTQAEEALYIHVQEMMLQYLDAWFEDIKNSGRYSASRLAQMEKEYIAQRDTILNDDTFREIYNEARKTIEEIDGNNADLDTLSTKLKDYNKLSILAIPPVMSFRPLDVVVVILSGILLIASITLLILKRKGVAI